MKNIISSFLVFCSLLVSQVGFAQDRVIKQVHIDAAKKDITEIKKYIELTSTEEEGIYKVLLDKNEYLNGFLDISAVRRNWIVGSYTERICNVLQCTEAIGSEKFNTLMKNQILLQKVNLHMIPEKSN